MMSKPANSPSNATVAAEIGPVSYTHLDVYKRQELKGTVTSESLKEIKTAVIYQLAKELLEGKYDKKFRFSTYHSCKHSSRTIRLCRSQSLKIHY